MAIAVDDGIVLELVDEEFFRGGVLEFMEGELHVDFE